MPATRTTLRLAALLAFLTLCSACGRGVPQQAAGVVLLDPVPATPWPTLAEPVATAIPIPRDGGDWSVQAPVSEFAAARGGEAELRLVGKPNKRVLIPRSFEAGAFNRVVLEVTTYDSMVFRAQLLRRGEVELVSSAAPAPPISAVQTLVLDLPHVRAVSGRFDALALTVNGPGACIVRRVTLVTQPLERWLPDPAADAPQVEIGEEARQARGLSTAIGLRAAFDVPHAGRLEYSYGVPALLRHTGSSRPELRVVVEAESGARVEARHALDDPAGSAAWHAGSLDLAALAGRTAEVRFELDAAALALAVVGEVRVVRPGPAPPTVLLVTSDTHRGDYVGYAERGAAVRTPVLDALAARGARFDDCFSAANITNPSHIALMTAVHPRDVGILVNNRALSRAAPTLAEAFREGGFATAAVVSTRHLGDDVSGLGQGFGRMSWPSGGERDVVDSIAVLERWLPEFADQPLFVWLHLFDAHSPYDPPEDVAREFYDAAGDPFDPARPTPDEVPTEHLPAFLEGLKDPAWPEAMYRGEISHLDRELARVFAVPRIADGWVAFTADHGESLGQHGIWYDHADLFPDTIHVPLVLAGPGVPAGERVTAPVENTDVGRTLLDLAGLADAPFPGRDLLRPAAVDPAGEPRFALAGNRTTASITWRGWHLMLQLREHAERIRAEPAELHQVELYDLQSDPGCLHDRLEDEPERARRMRATLVGWLSSARDLGWAGAQQLDGALVAALAGLGYTQGEDAEGEYIDPECACAWCARFR